MAQINVVDLTFCYEDGFENIFEKVSFSIDTNWKLGLIGRNGKGKTTFLNLLLGKHQYNGFISTKTVFDYFPYTITKELLKQNASDFIPILKPGCEEWKVICELEKLNTSAEILYRPFESLSHGERTKVMLAILFARENDFLLIDEPTNHLDFEARGIVKKYLSEKKSFILVSHDRDLLDACIDHVLVLNRNTIEVQAGNFSSWWENKQRQDHFAQAENEKHLREIHSLKQAVDRSERWANKSENSKIGFNPVKEHDRCVSTRAYIGAKTKKMQAQVKNYEKRIDREITAKEGLLQDIEYPSMLKLYPLEYHKERLLYAKDLSLSYDENTATSPCTNSTASNHKLALKDFSFEIKRKERVFLHGGNGCGKSTLIKAIIGNDDSNINISSGELCIGAGLKISYINQDTSFLQGSISDFCEAQNLEESLLLALLRQLDMDRTQFATKLEDFSEGQKKKVLLAASIITPAHLYIWDEPLNYIDVFSRIQIEKLLTTYQPTMLIVEHDIRFREKLATRTIVLE